MLNSIWVGSEQDRLGCEAIGVAERWIVEHSIADEISLVLLPKPSAMTAGLGLLLRMDSVDASKIDPANFDHDKSSRQLRSDATGAADSVACNGR